MIKLNKILVSLICPVIFARSALLWPGVPLWPCCSFMCVKGFLWNDVCVIFERGGNLNDVDEGRYNMIDPIRTATCVILA